MFVNQCRLPHVLKPNLYFCPEQYQKEIRQLFRPSWQVVGSLSDIPNDGDFLTRDLFGTPIIVRNFSGSVHTFLNVCPHRHCLLSHEPSGNSSELTCQYHGWQFNSDGHTGKIPFAQNFRPMPGGPECLKKFCTEVRGPMIFVNLNDDAPDLGSVPGPLIPVCDEFPAARWRQADTWSYDFEANWKVVVENTVEAYHVPTVHPKTLVSFGTEEEIEHVIMPDGTIMRSPIVSPAYYNWIADRLLPFLQPGCTHRYRLYHTFPNLFMMRIDAMLQVMAVFPTSPETCHMTVHVFTLRAENETVVSRTITKFWESLKARIIRQVLAEDARLYPDLQKGMRNPNTINVTTSGNLITVAGQSFNSASVSAIVIVGESGNDTITVSESILKTTYIFGGWGNDTVNRGGGTDYIHGSMGNDTLNGRAGNDAICGGGGVNTMTGGTGTNSLYQRPTYRVYTMNAFEMEIVRLTNPERTSRGLAALTVSAEITCAANQHANQMASRSNVIGTTAAHNHNLWGVKLPTVTSRLDYSGFEYSVYRENIAYGYTTAAQVVAGWMNSPGHRANILSADITHIGLSAVRNAAGTWFYCQNFAKAV